MRFCCHLLKAFFQEKIENNDFSYGSRGYVYDRVARHLSINTLTVRRWVGDYEATHYIKESIRGKHTKMYSLITEDLEFRAEFKGFVKRNSKVKGK